MAVLVPSPVHEPSVLFPIYFLNQRAECGKRRIHPIEKRLVPSLTLFPSNFHRRLQGRLPSSNSIVEVVRRVIRVIL